MRMLGGHGKRLAPTAGLAFAIRPAWAQQGSPSGWMTHGPWDGWSWMMMMGPLVMILVLAALVVLVVFLVRWLSDGGSGRSDGRQRGSGEGGGQEDGR